MIEEGVCIPAISIYENKKLKKSQKTVTTFPCPLPLFQLKISFSKLPILLKSPYHEIVYNMCTL